MINAGAIVTASLVRGGDEPALERLVAMLSRCAGRELEVDWPVYESERSTGHRNRAIGHLLRNFNMLTGDPEEALDLYFAQCSVSVTCVDLALMGATLANAGRNPRTGEQAISSRYVPGVLTVMGSCGMYDYAGEWIYRVGMPAKSGVSGGVLAVLPGQFGIGVFSPRLDERGNSVRGVRVCADLSSRYELHMFNTPQASRSAIRAAYTGAAMRSKRERSPADRELLAARMERVQVIELQGDVTFASVELFTREVLARQVSFDSLIIDLKRVERVNDAAAWVLLELFRDLLAAGRRVAVCGLGPLPFELPAGGAAFEDVDHALEWCEDAIIASAAAGAGEGVRLGIADNELCVGLASADIERLSRVAVTRAHRRGETIIAAGSPGDCLYLLLSGKVSVTIQANGGASKRVATLSAGMAFGELAALDESTRTADVRADTEVECAEIGLADFARLAQEHPEVGAVIYHNLARKLALSLRRANLEISALAG
jgi:glutaminase